MAGEVEKTNKELEGVFLMLKIVGVKERERLVKIYKDLIFDDHFQWVSDISTESNNFASISNPNYIEFISESYGGFTGYMFARIDESNRKIAHISNCINFDKTRKRTFGCDLLRFIRLLKKSGIEKLEFAVWEGNPAKEMYDKIKGVRYVGYYSNAAIHRGKEINIHLYELFI